MQTCFNCFNPIEKGGAACRTCAALLHRDCAIKDGDDLYCDTCYTVKQEVGEKVIFTMPDVIRRSNIELYKKCPYAFYLSVILGKEAPPTAYTQVGIDLHDLFEAACKNRRYLIGDMERDFMQKWDSYPYSLFENDFEFREKMHLRAVESISAFYKVLHTLPSIPLTTEEKITFSIGEDVPNVCITMDRVDEVDGELEVSDWKTGAVLVGQKHSDDLQAPLYIYAVQKHFGMKVRKFTFYYLQAGKTRVFVRDETDPETFICTVKKRIYKINTTDALREVNALFSKIKNAEFNIPLDTKSMYFACKMCHHLQSGDCKGAEVQSWHQYNSFAK